MALYIVISTVLAGAFIARSVLYSSNVTVVSNGKISKEKRTFYDELFFCFVLYLLWFLTAFRGKNIGNDTKAYIDAYLKVKEYGPSFSGMEFGYQSYCYVITRLMPNSNAILIVTATVCYFGVGYYALQNSDDLYFSLILIFCLCFSNFVNILRQSIAMVICLYAYQMLKKKQSWFFVLSVLIASTFHLSALVFWVVGLYRFFPKNTAYVFIVACVITVASATGMIPVVLEKILPKKYAGYFESTYAEGGWIGVSYEAVKAAVLCLIAFSAYRGGNRNEKLILTSFSLTLSMVCFGYCMNQFIRICGYFSMISIAELPNATIRLERKASNKLSMAICGVMLVYFFVTMVFRPEWNHLYPFEFWQG